jgi:hypothetical protein
MKSKYMWGIIVIVLIMTAVSCTPAAPAPLVGCKADLSGVFLTRRGADSAVVITTYTVSNPNQYMVTVDDLVSNMDAGQGFVLYEQIPHRYYIPAGENITIQGSGVLDFTYAVAEGLFSGATMAQAVGKILPVWKSVGNMPAGLTKEIWNSVPAKDMTFSYTVSIHTSAQGIEKRETTKGISQPVK